MYIVYLSYHSIHTTTAERRAEKQRQRRSTSSGQKTRDASREKTPPPPFLGLSLLAACARASGGDVLRALAASVAAG